MKEILLGFVGQGNSIVEWLARTESGVTQITKSLVTRTITITDNNIYWHEMMNFISYFNKLCCLILQLQLGNTKCIFYIYKTITKQSIVVH